MKQNNIQQQSNIIFLKNLDYFELKYPAIYKKIVGFQNIQSNNSINNRYSLEYHNNSFNLFNIKKKKFFYNKGHLKYDKNAEKSIDYSSENLGIKTIPYEILTEEYANKTVIQNDTKKIISDIKYLTNNFDFKEEKLFKKINKFIFLGTMLGTHLEKIHKNILARSYLIVEPDIEIFFLSLFVTKYYSFAPTSHIEYSIMDSQEILLEKLAFFHGLGFNKNYLIKYYLSTKSYSYLFNIISMSIINLPGVSYSYYTYLKTLKRTIKYVNENNNIINLQESLNVFSQKPVLIVAPGFSLKKNLQWLKKYQNRFIIIAYSQTLKRLLSENIKPDIITIVDYEEMMYENFDIQEKELFKEIILLACTSVHVKITNLFDKKNLFFYEKDIILKTNISRILSGVTVGETTYSLALLLKAKEIYLLGTDLCVNMKTGNTHDTMHSNSGKDKLELENIVSSEKLNRVHPGEDLISVEGNLTKSVLTTFFYKRLISNYNVITQRLKLVNQKVYNLSNGAKLENIQSFEDINLFESFKILNKKKIHNEIQKKLLEMSYNSFSQIEKYGINLELIKLKKIIDELKIILERNIDSYESFDILVSDIMRIVLDDSQKSIYYELRSIIFNNYFVIHFNFIDYMLNSHTNYDYNFTAQKLLKNIIELLEKYYALLSKIT